MAMFLKHKKGKGRRRHICGVHIGGFRRRDGPEHIPAEEKSEQGSCAQRTRQSGFRKTCPWPADVMVPC